MAHSKETAWPRTIVGLQVEAGGFDHGVPSLPSNKINLTYTAFVLASETQPKVWKV